MGGEIRTSPSSLPRREIKKEPEPREEPISEIIYKVSETKEARVIYSKSRGRYMLWAIAIISIIFCLFALSFLFSNAEIVVDPKIKEVTLNENLSADKDSNTSGLPFDLVVIEDVEHKSVKATGEKDVFEKATGTVVIYNAFSSAPQTLSIDTRLEGSNGKIYKTETKIIVPGMKKGSTTPGSVEVKIYGAEAGEEYNSAPLDFKILGFKGTPKYSKFYGRSKGEIAGGFKGKAPSLSDEEKTTAINDIKTALQAKLLRKAAVPGFILFKDAAFFKLDDINIPLVAEDGNLTLTLKGTLHGILFNEQKLTKKIAGDNIGKDDDSEVYIPDIGNLAFSLADNGDISFEDLKTINFNLSGPAKIIFKLDENKFVSDLLGISKKNFAQVLSQYPNIESAVLKLRFPWMQSIPDEAENVKVIVNYPK